MKKHIDVAALGELLVDFTCNGASAQGNPFYEANPGGAPCNVLAMLAKLGKKTAFIGKVGEDQFGHLLRQVGLEAGISMDSLVMDPHSHTTLAFVKTAENGDRDFSFYRDSGADTLLVPDEVPEDVIAGARIFHFGSLSLTGEPVRSTTQKAVALARAAGCILSFDPNLRPPLWDDLEQAREQIHWGLAQCDVAKISDDELLFLTGGTDFDAGAAKLMEQFPNLQMVNVTAGAQGSISYYQGVRVFQPGVTLGGVIETTGAGDTFCACVLNFLLEHGLEHLTADDLTQMLRFANAAAYLVTTRRGAIRSMPEPEQVLALL
ncbi:carbohydrate kinase [Pseudoflavonifractor phocaeensis]|uniref:carbohydrate kinase family protein n=1 Tax=Pseudoflavonifractor phocaeensis TaxID=1870988 RepID=UPI0025A3E8F4|nr:carbohydrate kinase [Pseudoflavonifractor phocaeensis]MDM8237932.1 carbohydrate kinase [Pseudoflavonifractor phocaeensis]